MVGRGEPLGEGGCFSVFLGAGVLRDCLVVRSFFDWRRREVCGYRLLEKGCLLLGIFCLNFIELVNLWVCVTQEVPDASSFKVCVVSRVLGVDCD